MLVWYFLFLRRARWLPNGYAAEVAVAAMASGFLLAWRTESALALLGASAGAAFWVGIRGFFNNSRTTGSASMVSDSSLADRDADPGSLWGSWFQIANDAFWCLPFAWIPVRIGCVIERAHAGQLSESWLARAYPGGSRWDLALLELWWAVAASVVLLLPWRSQHGRWPAAFVMGSLGVFRIAVWPLGISQRLVDLWFPGLLCVAALGLLALLWRQGLRAGRLPIS